MSGKASLGTSQSQQDEGVESGQDDEQPGPSRRKRQPSMSETMPLYTLCKEDLDSMDKEVRMDETFVQHSTWWRLIHLTCINVIMWPGLASSGSWGMLQTPGLITGTTPSVDVHGVRSRSKLSNTVHFSAFKKTLCIAKCFIRFEVLPPLHSISLKHLLQAAEFASFAVKYSQTFYSVALL
uniref:FCP1-like phosphatase C-terminal domain-containing protein n=1 Tax=Haplochromis burtoni TaxID=8153 RepID=A0A3Q2VVZ6_HAPBU